MRKIIFLIIFTVFTTSYAQIQIGSGFQSPEVWYKPDSLIALPIEDSISWTDEYTVFSVVRSLNADSTNECLWSFAEDDKNGKIIEYDAHKVKMGDPVEQDKKNKNELNAIYYENIVREKKGYPERGYNYVNGD